MGIDWTKPIKFDKEFGEELEAEVGVSLALLPNCAGLFFRDQHIRQMERWPGNAFSLVISIFHNEHEWRVYCIGQDVPDSAPQALREEAARLKSKGTPIPAPTRYVVPKSSTGNYSYETMSTKTFVYELIDELRSLAAETAICSAAQRQCPACQHVDSEDAFRLLFEDADEVDEDDAEGEDDGNDEAPEPITTSGDVGP